MAKTFFEVNPQRYKQHQYPRRGGGFTAPQITIHTYEAPYTRSLLAAATWLTQRTNPGSYHCLAGAAGPRDVLQLAPWSHETWHCVPSNNWSIGISMVAYAHQWNSIPAAARDNLVKSAAYAAANAAKWLQAVHGRHVRPVLINRTQAMAKAAGIVSHAVMDPGRRTDPGSGFPWADFLSIYASLMKGGGFPAAPEENEDDMPALNDKVDLAKAASNSLGRDEISYGGLAQYAGAGGWQAMQRLPRIEATLKAQTAAIEALAKNVGVDPKQIDRVIATAVENALSNLATASAEVSINLNPEG